MGFDQKFFDDEIEQCRGATGKHGGEHDGARTAEQCGPSNGAYRGSQPEATWVFARSEPSVASSVRLACAVPSGARASAVAGSAAVITMTIAATPA
ncbi:MAG: hypothetical protein H0V07_10000 [Propionibacteriales bacterium]|nr:hypothetical protein [Propionibacteriales bacterium]